MPSNPTAAERSPDSRVPVQGDGPYYMPRYRWPENTQVPGTMTWAEHCKVWRAYDAKWHCGQSAERLAERGGFSFWEAVELVGHLDTWEPR